VFARAWLWKRMNALGVPGRTPSILALAGCGGSARVRCRIPAIHPSVRHHGRMGLFSRRSRGSRSDRREVTDTLGEWVAAHRGVEAFVEPKTAMTENSILLVAHDGEFTRRRVPSTEAARSFATKHAIPIYDATVVGYPQRMRDYSRREMILRQRAQKEALGE
jgi:hypothetical protein